LLNTRRQLATDTTSVMVSPVSGHVFLTLGRPKAGVSCIAVGTLPSYTHFFSQSTYSRTGSFVPITSQAITRAGNWGLYFKCRDAIDPSIATWTGTKSAVTTVTTKGAAPTWMVPLTMGIAGAMTGATFAVISGQSNAHVVLHI